MKTTTEVQISNGEQSPTSLIELAIREKLPVENLERLFALQERWEANKARKSFYAAMAEFQANVPVIEKKKQVSFGTTKYKYAELAEVSETIKDTMQKCGLSYRWEMDEGADKFQCTCIVSHIDGHSERTSVTAGNDTSGNKNAIQARGSAITYLQRYSLIAALGLTTANEDNDGQSEKPQHKEAAKYVSAVANLSEDLAHAILTCETEAQLKKLWSDNPFLHKNTQFKDAVNKQKATLSPNLTELAKPEHDIVQEVKEKEKKAIIYEVPESEQPLQWLSEDEFRRSMNRITEGNVEELPRLQLQFKIKKAHMEALTEAHKFSLILVR